DSAGGAFWGGGADAPPARHRWQSRSCRQHGRRRREGDATRRVLHIPRTRQSTHTLGSGEAGLETILVEAATEMGTGKPRAVLALDAPEIFLRLDRLGVKKRVGIIEARDLCLGRARRIERHEEIAPFEALQAVHPIADAEGMGAFG